MALAPWVSHSASCIKAQGIRLHAIGMQRLVWEGEEPAAGLLTWLPPPLPPQLIARAHLQTPYVSPQPLRLHLPLRPCPSSTHPLHACLPPTPSPCQNTSARGLLGGSWGRGVCAAGRWRGPKCRRPVGKAAAALGARVRCIGCACMCPCWRACVCVRAHELTCSCVPLG